jgi:uncharacterized protein (DUF2235 family)
MPTAKNIVFCADGTWNGPDEDENKDGVPDITNVLKLFLILQGDNTWASIRLKNEQEKVLTVGNENVQIAKYIHGVGDSDNPVLRILGGAFGAGIIARIVRGYTYISRNYVSGDRIFIAGFSRGAYTARALAGLICSEGLLDASQYDLEDRELAYTLATSAWRSYREKAANRSPIESLKHSLLNAVGRLPGFFRLPIASEQTVAAPVECVAVWDTVGSLGIPVFDQQGDSLDLFRFADENLGGKVRFGLHAVSLDERRINFPPTLWTSRAGITQLAFPGAHADVGGGYPSVKKESGLSDIALEWMIAQLKTKGLLFGDAPREVAPDPHGVLHTPWADGLFGALPDKARSWDRKYGLAEHDSIHKRVEANIGYAPTNRIPR